LTKKFTPAFYRTLQAQEEDKQKEALNELVDTLKKYLEQVKGPWFSGEEFSLADITVAPWINRIYILQEHRAFTDELVGGRWPEIQKPYQRTIKCDQNIVGSSALYGHLSAISAKRNPIRSWKSNTSRKIITIDTHFI
jgi:glutathione S-transferase